MEFGCRGIEGMKVEVGREDAGRLVQAGDWGLGSGWMVWFRS